MDFHEIVDLALRGAHAPSRVGFDALVETFAWTRRCVRRDAGHRRRDARAPPDHATSEIAIGSKLGIDATKKLPGEGFNRPWPPLIKMDVAVKNKINSLFGNSVSVMPVTSPEKKLKLPLLE